MSSNLVIPFNQQPDSIEPYQSTHTVPAGKYARVTFFTADAMLDSEKVYQIDSLTWTSDGLETAYLSVLSPGDYFSITRATGSETVTISGAQLTHGAATETSSTLATGVTSQTFLGIALDSLELSASIPSSANRQIKLLTTAGGGTWTIVIQRFTGPVSLWVPSGTVVDGTRFVVETYNEIT